MGGITRCTDFVLVTQALDIKNVKIVSFQWLLDSMDGKKKVNEAKYLMASTTAAKDPPKNQTKGKKRARDASPDDEKTVKAEDEEKPKSKKHKDANIAQSGSLNVPIDEGCSLGGKLSLSMFLS